MNLKRVKVGLPLLFLGLTVGTVGAQNKPTLTEINFLVSGNQVEQTGNGDVTVEITFDRPMNQSVDPVVKFGLSEPFSLTVPKKGNGWISATLWQGFFTVSDNNPQTGDGRYIFKIYGAEDTGGAKMDTTLSTDLGKSLLICRSGELQLSTNALDFGTIQAGSSKTLEVTIRNTSCAPLNVSNVSVPPPFSLLNTAPSFTVAGESSHTLEIQYKPLSREVHAGQIVISSDDRNQATHTVQLSGTARGPQIALTPSSILNFGRVEVGSSATRLVVVTNQAAADPALSDTLRVNNITSSGAVYVAQPKKLVVPPDSSATIQVTFTPTQYRAYTGFILSFHSNDLTQPVRTLILNGDSSDDAPPGAPSNLRVTWNSAYPGFTNAAVLPICWDNPDDATGIAEVWWKFVSTPSPPQSPSDTTSRGGRAIVPVGESCASLPLLGKLTTGRWYLYLWLVDGSENSGYQNAVLTSFVYDVTPPAIPPVVSRTIPATRWFGLKDVFRLTLGIPPDAVRGVRDASEVRWKYADPPSAPTDWDGRFFVGDGANETVTVTIPFTEDMACGEDSLYIWLADSSGNVTVDQTTIARYRFDICPPEIKRVLTFEENMANVGQAYRDTLTIFDHVSIDTAWMRYRFGGATAEEPPRPLTRIPDSDRFVVEIPAAGVTRRGIEYTVVAVDSLGNQGVGPVNAPECGSVGGTLVEEGDGPWFPVRTRTENDFRIDADGRPVPLISGEEEASYQLISIPYDLDTTDVMLVLQDDLGAYDKTLWRLFDYKPDNPDSLRFLEGPDARDLQPGRSYFIITRQENIVVDSGPGVTRRTVCSDTLRLYEGWNLIATPFNFPVSKESLRLVNAGNPDGEISLRSFERGWNIVDVMDPWKGYALFVTRPRDQEPDVPIYLVVEPRAVPGRVAKSAAQPFELQPGDWRVQISARAGQLHDLENWAGVQTGAAAGFDRFELAEPPVIGNYLRVAFAHPEWRLPADYFSTDIRPAASADQVWEFEVKTNLARKTVQLSFEFLGDFPKDAQVYLVDETLKLSQNLRNTPTYAFTSGKQGSTKRLKLIVGSPEFATAQAGEVPLTPERFELLQNYPNPFNPETSIRYNLDRASRVTLEIYDLLGRRVRTLVRGALQPAGFYSVSWNGRDDRNRPVASGVYVYRLSTPEQSFTRKMILMK